MDELDANTAVGVKDQEGTKDRTIEAARTDVVEKVVIEEPKEEVKQEVTQKIFRPPSCSGCSKTSTILPLLRRTVSKVVSSCRSS